MTVDAGVDSRLTPSYLQVGSVQTMNGIREGRCQLECVNQLYSYLLRINFRQLIISDSISCIVQAVSVFSVLYAL